MKRLFIISLQQYNAYLLENTEESHVEMYDMIADPRFFRSANGPPQSSETHRTHETRETRSRHQPDLRQVVGLRNTLTCCVMQRPQYGKL